MADVLERIEAYKREEIAAAKRARPLAVLREAAAGASPPRGFLGAIERRRARGESALIADCILIIMAAVDDAAALELEQAASDLGMDVLVEIHDEAELDRALSLRSRLIGINNRDLKTFVTSLATTERLAPRIPRDRVVVAESGLNTPDDLARLAALGISTFLVGQSLMRQADLTGASRALLASQQARSAPAAE